MGALGNDPFLPMGSFSLLQRCSCRPKTVLSYYLQHIQRISRQDTTPKQHSRLSMTLWQSAHASGSLMVRHWLLGSGVPLIAMLVG